MDNTSVTNSLLKTEQEIIKCLSKRPFSLSELATKRHLSQKPEWYLEHCLERLEYEYLLIEELAQPEWEAFLQGRNYLDEPVGISTPSGKYSLTHAGRLAYEQMADVSADRMREILIPLVSAALGALFGAAASLAIEFLMPLLQA